MANEPSVSPSSSPASPSINPPPLLGPQARGEARAFDLNHLLPSQREAVESAARQLQQMAEASYAPRPSRAPTNLATALHLTIDAHRESRTLLLDGPRGSGKTSALLTLLQAWRDASVLQKSTWHSGASPSQPALAAALANPRGRILPVGIIDLQPLADGTNLLQLIASHFAHIVDAIDGTATSPEAPPSLSAAWQGGLGREPESRRCWRKLIATIAGGFDRSLQGRAAQLDLEAYALEFEQQGRHRLDLDIFYDFIESLLADLCNRLGLPRTEAPLFVLAIDDADMAPQRSVELLWTVRALWHPRCVFILTGHSDLFQLQLRQHYIGELLRPIGHRPVPSQDQDEIARQATIMASETYEKIIPPSQRHSIRPLEPSLRLTWELNRRSSTGETTTKLIDLLRQIRIPSQTGLTLTLADYFTIDEDTTAQLSEALPERPRRLLDLCLQLELLATRQRSAKPSEPGQASKEELQPCSEAVLAIWETALLGTDPILFDKLRRQVRIDPRTGALIVGTTNPREQLEGPLTPELKLFREMEAYEIPKSHGRVHVQIFKLASMTARLVSRQALAMDTADELNKEGGRELSLELVAALRLAANVAADQVWGIREAVSWKPTDLGLRTWFAAGVYTDDNSKIRSAWPLPDDLPFVDLAVFDLRWKRLLKNAPLNDRHWYLSSFIQLVISMHNPNYVNSNKLSAFDLFSTEMAKGHKTDSRRERIITDWVFEKSALLVAPESGVHDIMASWLSTHRYSMSWSLFSPDQLRNIRERRTVSDQTIVAIGNITENVSYARDGLDSCFIRWANYIQGSTKQAIDDDLNRTKETLRILQLLDHIHAQDISQLLHQLSSIKLWQNELRDFQNARPLQIQSIWYSACEEYDATTLVSHIQIRDGKLEAIPLGHRSGYQPQEDRTRTSSDQNLSFVLSLCSFSHIVPEIEQESTFIPSLYQAISDFSFSQDFEESYPAVVGKYWPGHRVKGEYLPQGIINLWPNLQFRMYKPAKALTHEWNSLINSIPFSNQGIPQQQWTDTLAFWFIEAQFAIAMRYPSPQPQVLIPSTSWSNLIATIKGPISSNARPNANNKQPTQYLHLDALRQWWPLIPLFACPESGLSHEAAAGILQRFVVTLDSTDKVTELSRIQRLRIDRLTNNESESLDKAVAQKWLKEIDAANPEHPLVKMRKEHGL